MKKFYFLSILMLTMMAAMLPQKMVAQSVSVWDGTSAIWTQGQGTEADPYLIETAQNLAWISEMVNNGVTTYSGVWFKLTSDLNMHNIAWVPIGNSTTNCFCGKFDGDNHFIDSVSVTGTYTYAGLFGITGDGADILNLGVRCGMNISGSGNKYAGGIVGCVNGSNTHVVNCHNTGSVSSYSGSSTSTFSSYTGGIIGYIDGSNALVENCNNTNAVSGSTKSSSSSTSCASYSYSGGVIGYINASAAVVKNCHNTGGVSSSASYYYSVAKAYSYSGGLIGYINSSNNVVERCQNTGIVSSSSKSSLTNEATSSSSFSGGMVGCIGNKTSVVNCHNTGDVSSTAQSTGSNYSGSFTSRSGGMTAYVSNNGTAITHCSNKGLIQSTSNSSNINSGLNSCSGGMVGFTDKAFTLTNSFNRGDVQAYTSHSHSGYSYKYSGGMVGCINNSSSSLKNCYSTGTLVGVYKGGIRGNTTGTVTNCYYLDTCGGTVAGGTPKTEEAMKSPSFPIILNADSTVFVTDLTPNVNDGYPIFGKSVCEVVTQNATNVGFTSAVLNGAYTPQQFWPGGMADVVGFEYKQSSNTSYTTVYANVDSLVSYLLSGLQNGTSYDYRFFIQKNGVTYYGNDKTFTTLACDILATVEKSATEICNGETATFTVSASSNYSNLFTFEWNNGSTDSSIIVSDASTYTVTVHDTNGCTATANASVSVNPLPQSVISGNTSLCPGESSTLTASGANSYRWSTGATTPVITVNSSGTYSCIFTNSYGCTSTQSVTVNVFDTPVITGNTSFCEGGSTTLTTTGGDSYSWSTGATSASIVVNTPGNYSVTVSSSNGCSGSASVDVVQNVPVNVSITGDTVICSGIQTTLTATSGSSYLWSSGETTQSIMVSNPATYSVMVTDANGCSSSSSKTVSMMEQAVISGNTHICEGESSTLSVSGTGDYSWNNGANTSFIVVSTSGNYIVTVSLPNGCSSTASANVNVADVPVPTIMGNTSLCQDQTTTLTANGGNSFLWNNGSTNNSIDVSQSGGYAVTVTNAEGCSATTNVTVTVNPTYNIPLTHSICQGESYNFYGQNLTTAGIYTQTLSTVNGCDSVLTLTLTVKPLPTPSITGNTTLCEGESTTLTANGGNSFLWDNGSTSSSISVSQSGVYTVTATNVEGCSATTNVAVSVNLVPTIIINGNTTICDGGSTMLTASGADIYSWSTGDNTASTTISAFGIYTVTGTSAAGCSNMANVTVLVSQVPQITITGNTDICAGENTTLTANGGTSYLWSNGNTNPTITVNTAGTWQVIGYNDAGCNAMASVAVNLWQPVTSEFTITTTDPCYTWNNVDCCESGDYTQTLETVHGCDSIVTLHLTVSVGIDDYNGFSFKVYPNPTSDIVNVEFGMGNGELGNVEIQLYDVYGKLLNIVPVETMCTSSLHRTQIDLSHLTNGVYVLKAVADGKTIGVQKVVRQ